MSDQQVQIPEITIRGQEEINALNDLVSNLLTKDGIKFINFFNQVAANRQKEKTAATSKISFVKQPNAGTIAETPELNTGTSEAPQTGQAETPAPVDEARDGQA